MIMIMILFIFLFRSKTKDIPQKYVKAVYREYTDSTYTTPKPRPAWAGTVAVLYYSCAILVYLSI